MLAFILPQFVGVFAQFGGELPALTQFFVTLTYLFNKYWYIFFCSFCGFGCCFISLPKDTEWQIKF